MYKFLVILFFSITLIIAKDKPNNIHDITVLNSAGEEVSLATYKGKVLLIVNVASKCGYTKQYIGLQKLYADYKEEGLEILAFPCNDFGGQEPGTNEEIAEFCSVNYGVNFTLFDKIKVLGKEKSPLYNKLIDNEVVEKGDVKWNFEKFLISKEGDIVSRFRSNVKPESEELISLIKNELRD